MLHGFVEVEIEEGAKEFGKLGVSLNKSLAKISNLNFTDIIKEIHWENKWHNQIIN